jgi:hypothetical protein
MANQNLFEKYGIKEVADVTFYRIERKNEVYESQRKIAVSSILKGALELQTVYPMIGGLGDEEGFEAYVFTNAEIMSGTNYECDDEITITETYLFNYISDNEETVLDTVSYEEINSISSDYEIVKKTMVNAELGKVLSEDDLKEYTAKSKVLAGLVVTGKVQEIIVDIIPSEDPSPEESEVENTQTKYSRPYKAVFKVTYTHTAEGATNPDPDKMPGTHEYSYEEQILMLFAKNQNLIDKTGVRYQFKEAATLFENLVFNDNFAIAPNSSEKVVVCGLSGRFTQTGYDLEEVRNAIANLTQTYSAKAYDVLYTDYAELIVEDEMGYYNPKYLGNNYQRKNDGTSSITFFTEDRTYESEYPEIDFALDGAEMWGKSEHYSINDAIDALKQKKKVIDAGDESNLVGINSIYGGYKVQDIDPEAGGTDLKEGNLYNYSVDNALLTNRTSLYSLEKVLEQLNVIAARNAEVIGKDLKVGTVDDAETSNRAIYVKVDGSVDTAAGAYIYLLKNKNAKRLDSDKDGIFQFEDKKGNILYYQDKVFAGVETLALVIIGNKGLIFVVNRYGTKNIDKIAWMVNTNGYVTNAQAKTLINNGLIHTVDVTVNDETFEATCTVGGLKIRKTEKRVNRYVPVLFLDTLKVSTLEQTAEQTAATGGKGNAQLIIWDYGKEITLTLQDALYSPASMSAMLGSYEGNDFTKGVKETKRIDRTEKCVAKRSFIVPAGNSNGVPSEGDLTAQAVYIDLATMEPYQDGAPIAEGEVYLKWTRSIAYGDNSLGNTIEISAEKFPGTYKVVGDTFARNKTTGEDQRFQFVIPQAKMSSEQTITLEAEGDPTVFDMTLTVLRPDDGVMVKLIQYDVVENEEENDGSTMVKDTENLNLLDDAEMYRVSADEADDEAYIGATEY